MKLDDGATFDKEFYFDASNYLQLYSMHFSHSQMVKYFLDNRFKSIVKQALSRLSILVVNLAKKTLKIPPPSLFITIILKFFGI